MPSFQLRRADDTNQPTTQLYHVSTDNAFAYWVYGGRVMRFDKKTGQSQNIAPESLRSGKYRFVRTMPLMFHPADDRMLLFATNVLWKTMNGGQSWEIISPDLTYEQPEVPQVSGIIKQKPSRQWPAEV